VWLFDEADARNQIDDKVPSSSLFSLEAEDCNEEDCPAVTLVAIDTLEIELSLLAVALNIEVGTWVLVDAISVLEVAVVALLSALMISFEFISINDSLG
jgi:hypothetical protein